MVYCRQEEYLPPEIHNQHHEPKPSPLQLPQPNAEEREAQVKEDFAAERPTGKVDLVKPKRVPGLQHQHIGSKDFRRLCEAD